MVRYLLLVAFLYFYFSSYLWSATTYYWSASDLNVWSFSESYPTRTVCANNKVTKYLENGQLVIHSYHNATGSLERRLSSPIKPKEIEVSYDYSVNRAGCAHIMIFFYNEKNQIVAGWNWNFDQWGPYSYTKIVFFDKNYNINFSPSLGKGTFKWSFNNGIARFYHNEDLLLSVNYDSLSGWEISKIVIKSANVCCDGRDNLYAKFNYLKIIGDTTNSDYFFEDFESTSVGSLPSEWTPSGNGGKVLSSVKGKSLAVEGVPNGCWAGIAYHELPLSNRAFTIEFDVYVDYSSPGCHKHDARLEFKDGPDCTYHNCGIWLDFNSDHHIRLGNLVVGEWQPKRWYHVRYDFWIKDNKKYAQAFIDGKFIGRAIADVSSYDLNMSYFGLASGNGKTLFDNVTIKPFESVPIKFYVPSLLAYYSFDNCDAKEDGPGRLDGTMHGNFSCVEGVKGKALYFDGSSYIDLPDFFQGYPHVSVCAWIKNDESSPAGEAIIDGWKNAETFHISWRNSTTWCGDERKSFVGYGVGVHPGHPGDDYDPEKHVCGTFSPLKHWVFVCMTFDGQTIKMYEDAQLVSQYSYLDHERYLNYSDRYKWLRPGPDIRLGIDRNNSYYFKGYLDELRIYNYPLSQEEISRLYAEGNPPQCDAEHFDLCNNQADCEAAGGYWYDNACHATPLCDQAHLDLCTTEVDCQRAGGYWWDDSCHDEPACARDRFNRCKRESDCVAIGGVWCGESCFPIEECPYCCEGRCYQDGCPNKIPFVRSFNADPVNGEAPLSVSFVCEAADSDGSIVAYELDINGDNIYDLKNSDGRFIYTYDTAGVYKVWCRVTDDKGAYSDPVSLELRVLEPSCSSSRFDLCVTESDCRSVGGYWYDGSCHAEPKECMSDADCSSVEFCMKRDCSGAGICQERPEICTALYEPVCGCDGKTYSNECYAHQAGVNIAYRGECQPSCDSEHLEMCTTEADCLEAGGYWYDGSCHKEAKTCLNENCRPGESCLCFEALKCDSFGENCVVRESFAPKDHFRLKLCIDANSATNDLVDLYVAIVAPDGTTYFYTEDPFNTLVTYNGGDILPEVAYKKGLSQYNQCFVLFDFEVPPTLDGLFKVFAGFNEAGKPLTIFTLRSNIATEEVTFQGLPY